MTVSVFWSWHDKWLRTREKRRNLRGFWSSGPSTCSLYGEQFHRSRTHGTSGIVGSYTCLLVNQHVMVRGVTVRRVSGSSPDFFLLGLNSIFLGQPDTMTFDVVSEVHVVLQVCSRFPCVG